MWSALAPGLTIFFLRIIDVAFYTLRFMMMLRNRRLLTWLFAFAGSAVFVIAVRGVLTETGNWGKMVGYAAGFATGTWVGMLIEERLAVGFTRLQIVSSRRGAGIAGSLRQRGYAVTEIPAQGKDGAVTMLHSIVVRRQAGEVERLVLEADPQAFILAQDVRPVQRGFWRN